MSELIRQPTFTGGEVDPELQGRTDWSKYLSSLKTMRNVFASPKGPAMNRSGTRWLAQVGAVLGKNWMLVPYKFSNDVAFPIVVSDHSMVVYDQSGTLIAVVAGIPYADADISKLKFHQLGNTVFFALIGYPPAQLSIIAGVWTYSLLTYSGDGFVAATGMAWNAATAVINSLILPPVGGGLQQTAWVFPHTYLQGSYVIVFDGAAPPNVTVWMALNEVSNNASPPTNASSWVQAIDASHPAKNLAWVCCIEWEDIFGNIRETSKFWTTPVAAVACYTDRPAKIVAGTLTAARPATFARILGYKFYKGLPGAFGYIGRSVDGTFSDDGLSPDFTNNPPENTDPTVFYDAAGAPFNSYPSVISFVQQRLMEAGFPIQVYGISFSEVGSIFKFDTPALVRDDAAFDTQLLSEGLNDIRSAIPSPGKAMLLFCGSSEWSIRGAQGFPLSPTSLDPNQGSNFGSSWLTPIRVQDMVLFNTALGQGVRDLEYDSQRDNMTGQDLSLFADHLFRGFTLVAWAYAERPYKLIWAVRSDGKLLGLTYSKTEQVIAWHRHDSPLGFFKAVCALPGGTEHSVFFIVERFGAVHLEKMSSRIIPDLRYGNFFDGSVQFDGHSIDGTTMFVDNGGANVVEGTDVLISRIAGGHPYAAGDEGTTIVFFPDSATSYVFTITAVVDADHASCTAEQDIIAPWTKGLNTTANWAHGRVKFAMSARYAGQTLGVLADASDIGDFIVAGGFLVINSPAVVVQTGVRYVSDVELLNVTHPSEETTPMQKTVKKVWAEILSTRSFFAGPDFSHLKELVLRRPGDTQVLVPFTGRVFLTSKTGWGADGRIAIRQTYALPMALVSVTREVEFGGT